MSNEKMVRVSVEFSIVLDPDVPAYHDVAVLTTAINSLYERDGDGISGAAEMPNGEWRLVWVGEAEPWCDLTSLARTTPMPTDPKGREMVEEVERDIRCAIWNAGMNGGMGQNLTLAFIRRAMGEAPMMHALSRLTTPTTGASAMGEVGDLIVRAEKHAAGHEAIYGHRGIVGELIAALRPSPQDERLARLEAAARDMVMFVGDRDIRVYATDPVVRNLRAALSSSQGGGKGK